MIHYFQEVLGVQSFWTEQSEETFKKEFILYIENYESYSNEEIELTSKILSSFGKSLADVVIVSGFNPTDSQPLQLVFKDEPDDSEIHSPRVLLKKPLLKKDAWQRIKLLTDTRPLS